jgi:hypothetical protein
MRLSYDLSEFSEEVCEDISRRLRSLLIPHLLDEKRLLIDNVDVGKVEELLSDLGAIEDTNGLETTPPPMTSSRHSLNDYERLFSEYSFGTSTSPVDTRPKSDDESGAIAMAGLLIGGGFGVLLVIAAFLDPTFEGRVYIFLPAIILGVIGFAVGSGIEKAVRQARKKW